MLVDVFSAKSKSQELASLDRKKRNMPSSPWASIGRGWLPSSHPSHEALGGLGRMRCADCGVSHEGLKILSQKRFGMGTSLRSERFSGRAREDSTGKSFSPSGVVTLGVLTVRVEAGC